MSRSAVRFGAVVGTLALIVALGLFFPAVLAVQAAWQDEMGGRNVLIGRDNDNAANTFIQPPGVTAKQNMENTDVLVGGAGADLLMGLLGSDVLQGGPGADILIGGTERGQAPNSDVIFGDEGDDISIWAPGDGSEAFLGGSGTDVEIFAPFVLTADGTRPELFTFQRRQIPHVIINPPQAFSCRIDEIPADQNLGYEFLARFLVGGNLTVTVRLADVEQVICTSPQAGFVTVADLTGDAPTTFVQRPVTDFSGTLRAILQPPS